MTPESTRSSSMRNDDAGAKPERRDGERSNLYGLLMQAPAIICVLRGPNHVIELANPLFQQLFGNRDFRGKTAREATPDAEGQGFLELLDRAYFNGETYVGRESRAMLDRRGDGTREEGFFDFVYQPMYDREDRIQGVMVFAFEVTEQVRARQKVEELAETLRQRNREKDDFIAVVSHELRTPLTSILGWARMLRLGGLDDDTYEEALAAIERSTRAQVKLVEDLLDEARITAGKLRLEMRSIDLVAIVESAAAALTPSADAKRITVRMDLASQPYPMDGDPVRLQQVFWNVLSNAIKFTGENGTILIRLLTTPQGPLVQIQDTGQGIDPKLLPHIFERFRQGDPAANERKGGLGLGLPIARHLVELHGGSLEATSDGIGKGATFTIRFPLPVDIRSGQFAGRGQDRARVLASLSGVRVLLVEDEADNRDVISAIVQRCGAEVRCAATAASGLEIFRVWRPNVIVCDIALPDLDGCNFVERIRAHTPEEGGRTPALALTVISGRDDRKRILAAGFQAYRQKPIEPADLAHAIARLAKSG